MDSSSRILIVEDDPIGRQLLAIYTKDLYDVTFAASYDDGCREVDGRRFDIVFTDLNLGINNDSKEGVNLLHYIRSKDTYRTVPVIAITAHMFSNDHERFLASGFNDIMIKPILKDHFIRKLNSLLPSSSQ